MKARRFLACLSACCQAVSILWVMWLTAGCSPERRVHEGVQLVLSEGTLGPTTTFEVRFDEPAVRTTELGKTNVRSPLAISPPLGGSFRWLSQRSGVFTPDEALRLGTGYRVGLRRGLLDAQGLPLKARLRQILRTPDFQPSGWRPNGESKNASSEPEIQVFFNADVAAGSASPFMEFRSSSGRTVRAAVRQGTAGERPPRYMVDNLASLETWREEFAMNRQLEPRAANVERSATAETNAVANFLIVVPRRPLPADQGWRLTMSRGLPAAKDGLRFQKSVEIRVGDVLPFTAGEPQPSNHINDGKKVEVHFSKALAPSLTNGLEAWMEISPRPSNLTVTVTGSVLRLEGDFDLNRTHKLTLRAGLPAREAFVLEKTASFEFVVGPVPPRLYFPETSTDQLAWGRREFRLLAVNVEKIRVRAKLMGPETAIHGLRGYGSYVKSWEEPGRFLEPYREIDYNLVPGRTVFEREVAGSRAIDQPETLVLKWDDMLGGHKAGTVFLQAERVDREERPRPRLGTEALIQLTDLGMVWKTSEDQICVFVFSHTTGLPAGNATVRVMSDENERLAEASTDDQGLAVLPASAKAEWAVAILGEDTHAVRLGDNPIPFQGFDLPIQWERDSAERRRVMLFSDRGVYRPGETIHLKAVVREWKRGELAIPDRLSGSLKCHDARGRVFCETNVEFGAAGSWNHSVTLPLGARGVHHAQLTLGSNDYWHSFLVQDFKPAAFQITLSAKAAVGAGEPVQVPVTARYHFGKRLSKAKVKWTIQSEPEEFCPKDFPDFSFAQACVEGRGGRGPSTVSLQGEGSLDEKTNYVVRPDLSADTAGARPRRVELLVEVTDLNQQTLSESTEFVQHSSEFYLGLKSPRNVIRANQSIPIEAAAVAPTGRPWAEAVRARLTFERIDWQSVPVENAGRTLRYRNEAVFTKLLEREVVIAPAEVWTNRFEGGVRGCLIEGITPSEAGNYLLELRAKDGRGRETVASASFHVAEEARLTWDYRNEVQIELVPDQAMYEPGQTAEILVKTPISGEAWVAVEREQVRRSFVTRLSGNAPLVRVPIEAGDSPNVFVSVTPVRGSTESPLAEKSPDYRFGLCMLRVREPKTHLGVEITAEKTDYPPGAEVRLEARVRDADGAPAAGAEIVLWAVDEGILSLTDYSSLDPHAFFYEPRRLEVRSGISLPCLMPENPEQLHFRNKGYLVGGGGEDHVRKDFLPCAYWNAALRTDSQGAVRVAFPAPDGMTRYRIMAVALAGSRQFGRGEGTFSVSKPLMIEPALPQFANVSDRLVARAVILNQTEREGRAVVTLELDDLARPQGASGLSNSIKLGPQGSAAVEFPVEFVKTGSSRWIWRARLDPGTGPEAPRERTASPTDSVQSTMEVGHVAPLLTEVYLSRVETAETNLLARANPQLLEGEGVITVTLANTRLGGLGEVADQLLHYPYGCVEQTGSSLLPWITLRDSAAAKFLRKTPREIDNAIRSGVDRLLSMQTDSGGLGYWPRDGEPMFWGSAYGGMVLALARRHGVAVPQEDFDNLLSYLSKEIRGISNRDTGLSECCLALYTLALAGRREAAYHEVLFQRRDQLSMEDRAILALAILESRGMASMVEALLAPASPKRATTQAAFGCPARETALRLLAWTLHRPLEPIVESLVAELVEDQKNACWATTQGNAWGLLALEQYAARVESRLPACEGTLWWGNATVPFKLPASASVFEHAFTQRAQSPSQPLRLAGASTNRVHAQVKVQARAKLGTQPRQDRGYNLRRTYARLDDQNQPGSLDNLRVGDRVLVTLHLEVRQPGRYVAIDDPLPAVLEVIHPEFKTDRTRDEPAAASEAWEPWYGDFRELRADRTLFFANHVSPGRYQIRYLARVRAAGQVTAPSAKVEEMYHPERFGLTESTAIASRPAE